MEKLPEKWFIKIANQEIKAVLDVFVSDKKNYRDAKPNWRTKIGCPVYYPPTHVSGGHSSEDGSVPTGYTEITFDQFKRLVLGETEEWEPKVGDYIVITRINDTRYNVGDVVKVLSIHNRGNHFHTDTVGAHIVCKPNCRLARPEEIPQEEVGYVECVASSSGGFTTGRIYKVKRLIRDSKGKIDHVKTELDDDGSTENGWGYHNFKPSTREAYEAQQKREEDYELVECIVNTSNYNSVFKAGKQYIPEKKGKEWFTYEGQQYSFKGATLAFKRVLKNNQVNKCSTINEKQNECKNENKNSKTNDSMDSISGGTGGQEIRLRTKSVRVVCESGFAKSGREVSKTRRSSKRPKAETGRRFI